MYKLMGNNTVLRLFDQTAIAFVDSNRDYEEYKQWLEKGNIPVPEFSNKQLEEQGILSIKTKCNEVINSKYPIYKQLNISNLLDGYTDEDKNRMNNFINSTRAISKEAIIKGTSLKDIYWSIP